MKRRQLYTLIIVMFLFLTPSITLTATVTDNWWDKSGKPKYGGTIQYYLPSIAPAFDPWFAGGPFIGPAYQLESLFGFNWTLDRNEWSFNTGFTPAEYCSPSLAESWEIKDPQNIIFKIRQGVKWQNAPPVNGREFTASDVEFHYQRMLGSGPDTKPSPVGFQFHTLLEQVIALDKYDVQVKFKNPTLINLYTMTEWPSFHWIVARESVEVSPINQEQGIKTIKNWKDVVGTSPWIMTDFQPGSSANFKKNPDYWGFDERHPDNRLPYADNLKVVAITDIATALAALRSGQLDYMQNVHWAQAESLVKTNPELVQYQLPAGGYACSMRVDKAPFNDIRVRKALQMALDRPDIAKGYYGGIVEGTPTGMVPTAFKGYYVPFKEWPASLQAEYTYNPEKAKELLKEAGYPDGFKTNVVTANVYDLQLLQIIKSYFMDIGVDMEIRVMDMPAFRGFTSSGKPDQMTYDAWVGKPQPPPWAQLQEWDDKPYPKNFHNDKVYSSMVKKIFTAADTTEQKRLTGETDMYLIRQHWSASLFPIITYNITQPYLKGYSGEYVSRVPFYTARWWKDQ